MTGNCQNADSSPSFPWSSLKSLTQLRETPTNKVSAEVLGHLAVLNAQRSDSQSVVLVTYASSSCPPLLSAILQECTAVPERPLRQGHI
jgi:hypothetical protein